MGNRKVYDEMEAHEREDYTMDGGTALAAGGGALVGGLLGNWFGGDGYGGYGRGRGYGGCGDGCGGFPETRIENRLDFNHTDGKLDKILEKHCGHYDRCNDGIRGLHEQIGDNARLLQGEKFNAALAEINFLKTDNMIKSAFEKQEAEARAEKILASVVKIAEKQEAAEQAARDARFDGRLDYIASKLGGFEAKVLSDDKVDDAVSKYKKWDVLEDRLGKLIEITMHNKHEIEEIERFLNGSSLVGSTPTAVPDPPIV